MVSYCCYNKLPQLKTLQTYSIMVLDVKVQNQFFWVKVKVSMGLVLYGSSEGESILFSASSGCPCFLACSPFSIFKVHYSNLCFHYYLAFSSLVVKSPSVSFLTRWLWLHFRSTWLIQINLQLKILKIFLPYKVT